MNMRKEIYIHCRFFIYGLISFYCFGVLMYFPMENQILNKNILTLALSGGASMILSCASCRITSLFIKDLIYGME